MNSNRQYNTIDRLIDRTDRALRTFASDRPIGHSPRPTPAPAETISSLNEKQRKHAAGLMRINHTGEVCAQALYQGQSLTAKLPEIRKEMDQAADEELDHLCWCSERLEDLGGKTSLLNPLWYGLSFGLGATAGLISDSVSLGFVAATEELVCTHLEEHLEQLPEQDMASRAVVTQMIEEERGHGENALKSGGAPLPKPIKFGMRVMSTVMTQTTYYI